MSNNDQHLVNGEHQNDASTSAGSSIEPYFDASYVKVAGESIGITGLSETCLSKVAASTTYIVKTILEHARKYAVHARRKRLLPDDIDAAVAAENYPPLFGFSSRDLLPFRYAGSLGRDLFVYDDREIELTPIVNAPAVKIPLGPTLKAHWLVIEGVQPAVPENPAQITKIEPLAATSTSEIDFAHRGLQRTEHVQLKNTTIHTLSVEQQIFFKEITEAVMGSDDGKRTQALHSLQTDAGLQQLIPRFSLAIFEGVRCNIAQHNLAILIYLMRMIQSLASNQTISLERCLHEILPSVISCILSKNLCSRPETDNHWALREFSSRLLANICRTYNSINMRSRVTKVLSDAWQDDRCTLSTLYGSLYALNELGVDTVRSVVVPRSAYLYNDLRKTLTEKVNNVERTAAEKLHALAIRVLVLYVRNQKPPGLKEIADYRSMFGGFGDAVFKEVHQPSAASASNINNAVGTNATQKRTTMTPNAVQQRLTAGGAKTIISTNSSRFMIRSPATAASRASPQQPYINVSSGGRLQQTGPTLIRPSQQTSYYIAPSSGTTPFVVRPSGYKKVILAPSQRGAAPTANDGYRNV